MGIGDMVLLPLLLLTSQASTVTVTFLPTPLPKALAILSQASGRKLEYDPSMVDEVVLARLKDAPVDTALGYLAQSLWAKWVRKPSGALKLVPDTVALEGQMALEEAKKLKRYENALEHLRQRLSQQPEELDAESAQRVIAKKEEETKRQQEALARADGSPYIPITAVEEMPAWRLVAALALKIDLRGMLPMPWGAREDWAENPTPRQHAFPGEVTALLERYRREFVLWHPDKAIRRVKFTCGVGEFDGGLWASFSAWDTDGAIAEDSLIGLDERSNDDSSEPQRENQTKSMAEAPLDTPQETIDRSVALSLPGFWNKGRGAALEKVRPRLMDPVNFEPTQWFDGVDFVNSAERLNRNLIGSVGDDLHDLLLPFRLPWNHCRETPTEFLRGRPSEFTSPQPGWIVAKCQERRYRVPRPMAKQILDDCALKGGLTVDDAAYYVDRSTDHQPMRNWFGDYLRSVFLHLEEQSCLGTFVTVVGDDKPLRFWASISKTALASLKRCRSLPISSLPPLAIQRLEELVYWDDGLDNDRQENDSTDSLPNGILSGDVAMKVEVIPLIQSWFSADEGKVHKQVLTFERFAELNAAPDWTSTFRTYDRFRIGFDRIYTLIFALNSDGKSKTITLRERLFDPSKGVLTQIPADVQAQIDQTYQKAKNRWR